MSRRGCQRRSALANWFLLNLLFPFFFLRWKFGPRFGFGGRLTGSQPKKRGPTKSYSDNVVVTAFNDKHLRLFVLGTLKMCQGRLARFFDGMSNFPIYDIEIIVSICEWMPRNTSEASRRRRHKKDENRLLNERSFRVARSITQRQECEWRIAVRKAAGAPKNAIVTTYQRAWAKNLVHLPPRYEHGFVAVGEEWVPPAANVILVNFRAA
jgi:hypothetical protein